MDELEARVADGWAPPMTPAERAAMETDRDLGLHFSSRREPCSCEQCLTVLPALWKTVRRYINAATPHIVAARDKELQEAGWAGPWEVVPEEEING
jgi:hypothetical protein